MNPFKKLFARPAIKKEIDEELRFHIEQRTAENMADGMTLEEASREARKRFGNWQTVREECRDRRGASFGEAIVRDLHFAARQLVKKPGFTAVALLSLALGLGLNTAMFKLINTLLLQPLDLPQAQNLYCVQSVTPQRELDHHSPAGFIEIKRRSADFADIAALRGWGFTLSESNHPAEMVNAGRVTANFFDVLRVQPELGRNFLPEEDEPGRNGVVLISHLFWMSRYGGDPAIIGRKVRLDGAITEIIGVLPERLDNCPILRGTQTFKALGLTSDEKMDTKDVNYLIVGRRRPELSLEQTQARFATLAANLAADHPEQHGGGGLRVIPLQSLQLVGSGARPITLMLLGLSGFVLLIACANLGNLILARSVARSSEFAIRAALGASRVQLVRPLAAECLILSAVGGALGVLVSIWTNNWMSYQLGGDSMLQFAFDWRVAVFVVGASLFAGFCCGIGPAWLISKRRVLEALKSGGRGSLGERSHHLFRQTLISGQFALALVLLAGAIFFVRGMDRFVHRHVGWNPDPLVCGMAALPLGSYPDSAHLLPFYNTLQERLSALPGVANVAISYDYPMTAFPGLRKYVVEGAELPMPGHEPTAFVNGISPSYFDTIGTRLLHGRPFNSSDGSNSLPVLIINEDMANALFPGKDAVGHRVAVAGETSPRWLKIVGVAENVAFQTVMPSQINFQVYQPIAQEAWNFVAVSVRAQGNPAALAAPIQRIVSSLDPDVPMIRLAPALTQLERSTLDLKLTQELLVGFAFLGLFLAALGIYGVLAHLVAQRTAEIGIRMALGAQVSHVVRLILSAGMRMTLFGAVIGLVGAVGLGHFLVAMLPGLATNNIAAIAASTALLVLVAVLACLLPARRATKVNPIVALRHE